MRSRERVSVLVVGQTPPPYHGQALMIQSLVEASFESLTLYHVRLAFSRRQQDIGRFRPGKLVHLAAVILRILWMWVRHRPDVLYYPPAGPDRVPVLRDIAILLCTRALFPRVVFHFQAAGLTGLYPDLPAWLRPLYRWAYHGVDGAIHLLAQDLQDGATLRAHQAFVVPNGVEDHAGGDGPERKRERLTILYVGSVRESKGILVLIEAVHRVIEQGIHCTVVIVGPVVSQAFERRMLEAIHAAELDAVIRVSGPLTGAALWSEYRNADLFCFPSFYESEASPRAVIEAMQFSLPVVATDWRGIPELVDTGETGYLVPVRDSRALADRLEQLLRNPGLRVRMGASGRKRYEQEFTLDKHLDRIEDVIHKVMAGGT